MDKQPGWWVFLIPVTCFVVLTGCVGLFPPEVVQLGKCGDYCFKRMFFVACLSIPTALCGLVCLEGRDWRIPTLFFATSGAVFLSGVVNWKLLDQDPLAAWLNWKAPFLKYDPRWHYSGIENHEQIYYEPAIGLYYCAGAGIEAPPAVQRYWAANQ